MSLWRRQTAFLLVVGFEGRAEIVRLDEKVEVIKGAPVQRVQCEALGGDRATGPRYDIRLGVWAAESRRGGSSGGIKWDPVGPIGIQSDPLGPSGTQWDPVGSGGIR